MRQAYDNRPWIEYFQGATPFGHGRQRPDFAERRLAIAMIRDVIGELDRYAVGDRKRKDSLDDAIAWVKGEIKGCRVTLETVCSLIGWETSHIRKLLLARIEVPNPKKRQKQEQRGFTRKLGMRIERITEEAL